MANNLKRLFDQLQHIKKETYKVMKLYSENFTPNIIFIEPDYLITKLE